MKKRSEVTETLRAGCTKTEPKIFASPQTPFPGARDGQNLISWRWSLALAIQTQFGEDRMHAISSYHTQTDRGDYNSLHCAAASLARSVMNR